MSKRTYQAVMRFPINLGSRLATTLTPGSYNAPQFYAKRVAIEEWLERNGYNAPLMIYNNSVASSTTGEFVVVLDNRDAAMMLKLSLPQ